MSLMKDKDIMAFAILYALNQLEKNINLSFDHSHSQAKTMFELTLDHEFVANLFVSQESIGKGRALTDREFAERLGDTIYNIFFNALTKLGKEESHLLGRNNKLLN